MISQIVTSKNEQGETRGGRQKAPYVFTEQGIAMLSGILKSDVAVQVSIRLMNIFVAMRKAAKKIVLADLRSQNVTSKVDVMEAA